MKRNTLGHPKTRRLAQLLGADRPLPLYQVAGILECLWQWTATYAPAGDVGRWEDRSIADGIGWEGDPGELVRALVAAGYVDEVDACRLVVHDWPAHAEDAVHMHLARATRYFADGSRPKLSKLGQKERLTVEARYAALEAESVRTACAHSVRGSAHTLCAPPLPLPLPLEQPSPQPPPATRAGAPPTEARQPARPPGSTLSAHQARQAADRIAARAAALRLDPISDQEARELARRLRRGQTSEAGVIAELEATAAATQAERQEAQEFTAAQAYAASRGGWPVLARGVEAWLERNRGPDESEADALERWATEDAETEAPPRAVLERLTVELELERRRKGRSAA